MNQEKVCLLSQETINSTLSSVAVGISCGGPLGEKALRLVAPVQGGLCHKALAVLYVPIQVGPVF